MASWNLGLDEDEQEQNGPNWYEEGQWNFDALSGDIGDAFNDFSNLNNFPPPAARHSSHAALPSQRPQDPGTSHAPDTSFLDELLHATAPGRRRPQNTAQDRAPLPRRNPAEQTRVNSYVANTNRSTHAEQQRSNNTAPQGHFGYIPLFDDFSNNTTPASTRPSTSLSRRASEELETLEDDSHSEDEEEADTMPATTRRRTNLRGSEVVDLTSGASTTESSRPPPRGRKRSADASNGEGRAVKRGKVSLEGIEQIDLSKDTPTKEEELLQQQQQETIKQQQATDESQGPLKVGQRTCIICMENFTNCTIASCGHFYCHECLIQALLAGERNSDRGTGTCPQCRKPLHRNNKRKHDIIPLSFMKKATFEKNQRKRLHA